MSDIHSIFAPPPADAPFSRAQGPHSASSPNLFGAGPDARRDFGSKNHEPENLSSETLLPRIPNQVPGLYAKLNEGETGMTPHCRSCSFHKFFSGDRCTRPMTLLTGQILPQHNSGRATDQERDDKAPIWRKGALARQTGDVCGKTARHFKARAS